MNDFQKVKTDFLNFALNLGALEFLPYIDSELKNEKKFPYLFDIDLFITEEEINKLTNMYYSTYLYNDLALILNPDVIFSPDYKGINLVHSLTESIDSEKVEYAFYRNQTKDHIEGGTIVGANLKDKKVLIVDDVLTSVEEIIETIDIIIEQGGIPVGCLVCFNELERVIVDKISAIQQLKQDYNVEVYSALSFQDLVNLEKEIDNNFFTKIHAY